MSHFVKIMEDFYLVFEKWKSNIQAFSYLLLETRMV